MILMQESIEFMDSNNSSPAGLNSAVTNSVTSTAGPRVAAAATAGLVLEL